MMLLSSLVLLPFCYLAIVSSDWNIQLQQLILRKSFFCSLSARHQQLECFRTIYFIFNLFIHPTRCPRSYIFDSSIFTHFFMSIHTYISWKLTFHCEWSSKRIRVKVWKKDLQHQLFFHWCDRDHFLHFLSYTQSILYIHIYIDIYGERKGEKLVRNVNKITINIGIGTSHRTQLSA